MAKYYHSDLARWEGEGGAVADIPPSSDVIRPLDGIDRKNRKVAFLQVLSGVLIAVASLIYARRKGWI